MPSTRVKALIVGAGPAGVTAALQLQRYGIPFLIFEKERIGGLLWNATLVENYPGFPNGVSGPKLIGLLEKQLRRIGVEVVYEQVVSASLTPRQNEFTLATTRGNYRAPVLVVASGTQPAPFPIPIPHAALPCVFSDVTPLLHARDKQVAIVGAGDAAFDHALNLAARGNRVLILNRGRERKCLPLLAERIQLCPEILYRDEITVCRVEAHRAGGLRLHCQTRAAVEQVAADYLIFAIGREPQEGFLSASLRAQAVELTAAGRLYFIGDVRNGLLRQTAIAAGDGLRAAMTIFQRQG